MLSIPPGALAIVKVEDGLNTGAFTSKLDLEDGAICDGVGGAVYKSGSTAVSHSSDGPLEK